MNKLFLLSALALILCMSFSSAVQVNESVTATWFADTDGGNAQRGWVINSEVNANIISITKQSGVSGVSSGRIYVTSNGTVVGTVAFSGNVATFASPVSIVAGLNYSITAGHTSGPWTRVINTSALTPQDTGIIRWGTGVNYVDGGTTPGYSASGYNIFALIVDYTPFTVNLTNPQNNSGFNTTLGQTFNATGIFGLGTAVNATRYLYTSTGTLISTNFSNVIYAGNKTNFTMPSLVAGTYLWNINMCGSSGDCFFAPSNFTFTIDSNAPSVNGDRPINGSYIYSLNSTTSQFQINITAIDNTAIDKVWYTSTWNSTPTFVTNAAVSTVTLNNVFGKQTIYKYANDTAGNLAMNQTQISIARVSYNPNALILSSQSYSFNISYFNGLSANAISLIWNSTTYSPSISIDSAGNTVATATINMPAFTGVNIIPFYWSQSLSNGSIMNSTLFNQTVSSFTIDSCTSNTFLIANFTNYDQDTLQLLNQSTFYVQVRIGDSDLSNYLQYANNATDKNNMAICLSSDPSTTYRMDLVMQWNKNASYFTQYYNIQNYSLSSSTMEQNISLYNLLQSSGQIFNIIVRDSYYLPLSNALIQIDRQYIQLGSFLTAEIPTTDSQGSSVGHFVLNGPLYNIYIKQNGVIIAQFLNQQPYCNPLLTDCVINFNIPGSSSTPQTVNSQLGIYYTPEWFESTRTYSLQFLSSSSASKAVNLTGRILGNDTIVCSNAVTASSGTLSCAVPAGISNQTILFTAYVDGEELFADYVQIGYSSRSSTLSKSRYILAGLLLPVIVLMAASTAAMAMLFFVLGIILCLGIFLIDTQSYLGPGAFLGFFIFAAVLIIWKIAKGGVKNG